MPDLLEKRGIDCGTITPELWNDRAALQAWVRTIVQRDLNAVSRQLKSADPLIECHAEPYEWGYKLRAVYRTEIGLGDIPAGTKFFFHDYSKWPMERG